MLVTVAGTVATSNLAIGVGLGVLTAMAIFAKRVSRLVQVTRTVDEAGTTVTYVVTGELFFASEQELEAAFTYAADPGHVVIDLTGAHLWDASAVAALDAVEGHYRVRGSRVDVVGLNVPSTALKMRLAVDA
jgi:SulP family sulfate permease